MALDICIPAYNEAPIIHRSIERVITALEKHGMREWQIIVADNASTDDTSGVVRSYPDSRVSCLRIETKGKGAALIAAAHVSRSDVFGFIDADMSADPNDIAVLADLVMSGAADVVVGSRFLHPEFVHRTYLRELPSRILNFFRRVLLDIPVTDSQCGLKLMNERGRAVLQQCTETGWFLDLEFLARAEASGLVVRELGIHWEEETFTGRRSKLRLLKDGSAAVPALFRIRRGLRSASRISADIERSSHTRSVRT